MLPLVAPTANKSKRVQQEKLSMGKFFPVFLATAIVQLLLIQPSLAEPQTKNRSYYVLEIHAYHSGLSWTDSIIKGI